MDPKLIMRAGIRGAREKSMTLLGSAYQPVLTGTVVSFDGAFVTATVAGSGPVRLTAVAATYVAGQPVAVAVDGNSRPTYVLGPLVAAEVDEPAAPLRVVDIALVGSYGPVLYEDGSVDMVNNLEKHYHTPLPEPAVEVTAGIWVKGGKRSQAFAAVGESGALYAWGQTGGIDGGYDMFGNWIDPNAPTAGMTPEPTLVPGIDSVSKVALEPDNATIIVAKRDGTVWIRSNKAAIGDGYSERSTMGAWEQSPWVSDVVDVYAGRYDSATGSSGRFAVITGDGGAREWISTDQESGVRGLGTMPKRTVTSGWEVGDKVVKIATVGDGSNDLTGGLHAIRENGTIRHVLPNGLTQTLPLSDVKDMHSLWPLTSTALLENGDVVRFDSSSPYTVRETYKIGAKFLIANHESALGMDEYGKFLYPTPTEPSN